MKLLTNPANVKIIRDYFISKNKWILSPDIFMPKGILGIEVITDPLIPPTEWTGRWLQTEPNNPFVTFIDDIGNPPEWAIFFGFVKKEIKPLFYEMTQPYALRKNRH